MYRCALFRPWTPFTRRFHGRATVAAMDAPPRTHMAHLSSVAPVLLTLPDAGIAPVYDLLRSANNSIDVTMYELVDTAAEQILVDQAGKGVKVCVLLDRNLEGRANTPAYTLLQGNGVEVVWASKLYAATHQKTITIDRARSAIMSLNLTSRYYADTRDFALLTSDPADVGAILATLDADLAATALAPPTGTDLVWSPTDATGALTELIGSARQTLDVENEEMSSPSIVSALEAAAKRGVQVRITMSLNPAYTPEYTALLAAGATIHTYAQTAPLYIHAKVVLADAGLPGQRGFLGSENFSTASLTRNRELGLLLTDPAILASLAATLTADFAGAQPWSPQAARAAINVPVRKPS